MNVHRILVTGANGFIGRRLCSVLQASGITARAAVRQKSDSAPGEGDFVAVGGIDENTDWDAAVDGISSIIHLAGRAHVLRDDQSNPLSAYRRVNVSGTVRLARTAAMSGVKRLVFVSSIKVNGEATGEIPFTELDVPHPVDPYGVSKLEAEEQLKMIGDETGLEIVVVRPPLVYGPGVKGNFLSLLRLIRRGIPLPLGACMNRRRMIGLDNMVALLVLCAMHPRAAGNVFLAGDQEDVSTPLLVERMANALSLKSRLVSVPPALLRILAGAMGRHGVYDRLCGSLRVDIGHAQKVLGWTPAVSMEEELARTASWFLSMDCEA